MCSGKSMPTAKENERRSQMASMSPRRLALKFSPPTVILEYSGENGFLHYKVHLRGLEQGMVRPIARSTPRVASRAS